MYYWLLYWHRSKELGHEADNRRMGSFTVRNFQYSWLTKYTDKHGALRLCNRAVVKFMDLTDAKDVDI